MDRYFKVDAGVRYWEDGVINGKEDDNAHPEMPFVELSDDEYRWRPVIDLKTGHIVNWPDGLRTHIHYKVCDDGIYSLLDENMKMICSYECYVPKILAFNDSVYYEFGDYIVFDVDETGHIVNWPNDEIVQELIDDFKKTKGF